MPPERSTFRFSILPARGAWTWRTLAPDGQVVSAGVAPTQQFAAACVIRALAQGEIEGGQATVSKPSDLERSAA